MDITYDHMDYNIKKLAHIAGISVRTLHFYDETGLLRPKRSRNGYRTYEEADLLKLQQIMFFRELEFPINKIKEIMSSPSFDIVRALSEQKRLISLKRRRLSALLKTIDDTIAKINKEKNMTDNELYDAFKDEDAKNYLTEAEERWGHTDAYKQSTARVAKMTKQEMEKIKQDGEDLMRELASVMNKGAGSEVVQSLIARHYDGLRTFYEPNIEIYRGLAEMYIGDHRFAAYFERFAPGLAAFMRDAMVIYCDNRE